MRRDDLLSHKNGTTIRLWTAEMRLREFLLPNGERKLRSLQKKVRRILHDWHFLCVCVCGLGSADPRVMARSLQSQKPLVRGFGDGEEEGRAP